VALGPGFVGFAPTDRPSDLYAAGLEDTTPLPRLIEAMIERGNSDPAACADLGRNLLRVYGWVLDWQARVQPALVCERL
jgi:microsomal dipeptidase-like Zn-dependent dipeptidase